MKSDVEGALDEDLDRQMGLPPNLPDAFVILADRFSTPL